MIRSSFSVIFNFFRTKTNFQRVRVLLKSACLSRFIKGMIRADNSLDMWMSTRGFQTPRRNKQRDCRFAPLSAVPWAEKKLSHLFSTNSPKRLNEAKRTSNSCRDGPPQIVRYYGDQPASFAMFPTLENIRRYQQPAFCKKSTFEKFREHRQSETSVSRNLVVGSMSTCLAPSEYPHHQNFLCSYAM